MTKEFQDPETASIMAEFTQQMRAIAEMSQKRMLITGSATTSSGRVTVTVNADRIVIATRFSDDIDELTPSELAQAVTAAAQQAAAEVAQKTQELMGPLQDERAKMPKLSDLFDEDMPDIADVPPLDPASLAPPNSRERREQEAAVESQRNYTDVVDYDEWQASRRSGIMDTD
ncbi:YbaB/EbfC family nucleoid-associated protein [Nocardia sp. 2]|uniref:YbaB/EbfC family nucleoid-associated protein n=1 Tax=Nocardia acididurans TaxID=2802282 RepID=A0ABS1M4C7_9NOCA|nr:YbaB/EbfC family nucleoid-associated protein [Nocardia acididurans]MBL1075186.1 YbaB/EbfC family nucleoid-associated protein [Nocardia acididurans]